MRDLECRTRLPNFVLWKEDRMNMAHGVETRPAFLDHRLVEFCAGLPWSLKLHAGEKIHLWRRAMKGRLRGDHLWRRKWPFLSPG